MNLSTILTLSYAMSATLHRRALALDLSAGNTLRAASHRRLARMFERWVREEADAIIANATAN